MGSILLTAHYSDHPCYLEMSLEYSLPDPHLNFVPPTQVPRPPTPFIATLLLNIFLLS